MGQVKGSCLAHMTGDLNIRNVVSKPDVTHYTYNCLVVDNHFN